MIPQDTPFLKACWAAAIALMIAAGTGLLAAYKLVDYRTTYPENAESVPATFIGGLATASLLLLACGLLLFRRSEARRFTPARREEHFRQALQTFHKGYLVAGVAGLALCTILLLQYFLHYGLGDTVPAGPVGGLAAACIWLICLGAPRRRPAQPLRPAQSPPRSPE